MLSNKESGQSWRIQSKHVLKPCCTPNFSSSAFNSFCSNEIPALLPLSLSCAWLRVENLDEVTPACAAAAYSELCLLFFRRTGLAFRESKIQAQNKSTIHAAQLRLHKDSHSVVCVREEPQTDFARFPRFVLSCQDWQAGFQE